MIVVGKEVLTEFRMQYPDIGPSLDAWVCEAEQASWGTPHDVKDKYRSASIIGGSQVVFNLKGNKYRLLVKIAYKNAIVQVLRIATHSDYDSWKL